MNVYKLIILTLSLLFAAALSLDAKSSVWKVSSGDSSVYIAGTFHMLRPSDFPLPAEFDQAYADAEKVYFETDIAAVQGPAFQQLLLAECTLHGKQLSEVLSPEVLAALGEYCAEAGIPLEQLSRLKPALIVTTLAVIELQKLGISQEGVDMVYHARAIEDGKAIGQLEAPEEQVAFICGMGDGNEDDFVLHSLRDLKETSEQMVDLIAAWKHGDLGQMEDAFVNELRTDYPDLYKTLLVDRNDRWMPTIEACFESDETALILVGTAHLVGEDGVLKLLQERGYSLEQVEALEAVTQ